MRAALSLSCALLLAGPALDAAAIVRCEAADGKVTYSNTDCPPNSKATRKVDLSPPVVTHDDAKASAKDTERQPVKIEAAKPKRPADPARQDEELTAQIAAQRRDCDERARQLQHLQADLDAAPADGRSSAELALRRAQEDYRGLCARRR